MQEEVDLSVLEQDTEMAIQTIVSFLEQLDLEVGIGDLKSHVEDVILLIERKMQDLSDLDENVRPIRVMHQVTIFLNGLIPLLKHENSVRVFEDLRIFLLMVNRVLLDATVNRVDEMDAHQLDSLVRYLEFVANKTQFDYRALFERRMFGSRRYYRRKAISMPKKASKKDVTLEAWLLVYNHLLGNNRGWAIEITIQNPDDTKSLSSLALVLSSLKQINGVHVDIEDIRKGSLIARVRVWFKSDEARAEAKELLESTRKFAKGKLEKDYSESEKSRKEGQKIDAEREHIEAMLGEMNSALHQRKKELEVRAMELELERMQLENEKAALELFMAKKKALSELVAENIITNEQFKMAIQGQPYLEKGRDGSILIGETIEVIEKGPSA